MDMGADKWGQSGYPPQDFWKVATLKKEGTIPKLQLFLKNVLFYPEGSGTISLEPLTCTFVSRSSGFLSLQIFWWYPLGSSESHILDI
jgi:hypothetical protein